MYAQLLTSKAATHGRDLEGETSTITQRRKRKRKRKKLRQSKVSSLLVEHKTDLEHVSKEEEAPLPALVSYGDSSGSSEVSEDGHEDSSSVQKSTGPLPIPSAIQRLYETENSGTRDKPIPKEEERKAQLDSRSTTWDSDSDDALGYFECVDSSSGEDEKEDKELYPLVEGTEETEPTTKSVSDVSKTWSEKKSQWLFGPSQLSSYTCWKCNNVGHLAKDCTVASGHFEVFSGKSKMESSAARIPQEVQKCLALCKEMRRKKGQRCAECGIHGNLVGCLDCG